VKACHTYWTVIVCPLVGTLVVVLHVFGKATPTVVTVEEVFFASNSAYATLFAVINFLLLPHVIIKIADVAVVRSELFFTALALPAFCLFKPTPQAFDMGHFLAIKLVVLLGVHLLLVTNLVMAKPTGPKLTLADGAWTLLHARSFVMFATQFLFLKLDRGIRVKFWVRLGFFF
jgi:hypothetical protein